MNKLFYCETCQVLKAHISALEILLEAEQKSKQEIENILSDAGFSHLMHGGDQHQDKPKNHNVKILPISPILHV